MALTKIKGAGINISAAEKLYFDGGGTTYIQESADGVLDFYADNVKMLELLEGGTDYVWVPVDATKLAIGAGKDLNIYTSSDDAIIENITSDKDIIFKGNDGGSTITALTLDISAAGAATFNDKIIATELDISGNMDIDGTSNLDAVDIDGAVQIDATVTVGADDQGYDVIFYGDTASSNMTWDTSADDLILNDSRLFIDQDDNAIGIEIDTEASGNWGIYSHGKYAGRFDQDLSGGAGIHCERNIAEAGSSPLVTFSNDNANNTEETLRVNQAGDGTAVLIDQNGNARGLHIDTEATSGEAIYIAGNTATTAPIIMVDDADALTTGNMLKLYSNSSSGASRSLVQIINDHTSATDTACLKIQQDASAAAAPHILLTGEGGIKFDDIASSNANTLDDYEEGTFTPTIGYQNSGDQGDVSYVTQTGTYTKIGDRVHVSVYLKWTLANTAAADNISITGFPFTSNNVTSLTNPFICIVSGTSLGADDVITTSIAPNSTAGLLQNIGGNAEANMGDDFGANSNMIIETSGTYGV